MFQIFEVFSIDKKVLYINPAISYKMAGLFLMTTKSFVTLHSSK